MRSGMRLSVGLIGVAAACGPSRAARELAAQEASRLVVSVREAPSGAELDSVEVAIDDEVIPLRRFDGDLVASLPAGVDGPHRLRVNVAMSISCGIVSSARRYAYSVESVRLIEPGGKFAVHVEIVDRHVGVLHDLTLVTTLADANGEARESWRPQIRVAESCGGVTETTPEQAALGRPLTPAPLSADPYLSSPFRTGRPAPLTDPPRH